MGTLLSNESVSRMQSISPAAMKKVNSYDQTDETRRMLGCLSGFGEYQDVANGDISRRFSKSVPSLPFFNPTGSGCRQGLDGIQAVWASWSSCSAFAR